MCSQSGHDEEPDFDAQLEEEKLDMHCDFCDTVNPEHHKSYACHSFETVAIVGRVPVPLLESVGSWMACESCAAFIDANDLDGLLDRTVAHLASPIYLPEERIFLRMFLKSQYTQFMRLRLEIQ